MGVACMSRTASDADVAKLTPCPCPREEEGGKKEKEKEGPKVLDPDHMRRWLTRACREYSEKPTQFYIERKKKKIGQPIYRVYTDTDGKMGKGSRSSEFMMMGQRISSKSRKGNYYLMTLFQ